MSTDPEKPSAPMSISENRDAPTRIRPRSQITAMWIDDVEVDQQVRGLLIDLAAEPDDPPCACNPADRTGGGHDPECPEFDLRAGAEELGPNP